MRQLEGCRFTPIPPEEAERRISNRPGGLASEGSIERLEIGDFTLRAWNLLRKLSIDLRAAMIALSMATPPGSVLSRRLSPVNCRPSLGTRGLWITSKPALSAAQFLRVLAGAARTIMGRPQLPPQGNQNGTVA